MIDERGLKTLIEIDGGVTVENAATIIAAGADVLVAGNTVFKSADPKATGHVDFVEFGSIFLNCFSWLRRSQYLVKKSYKMDSPVGGCFK